MRLADYTIAPETTLIQAVAQMNANGSRTVVVVDGGKVTGLISEGDVMRALLRGVDTLIPASQVANASFRFLTKHDPAQAFAWFRERTFGLIPVVDDEFRLVAVVTLSDMLQRVELVEPA